MSTFVRRAAVGAVLALLLGSSPALAASGSDVSADPNAAPSRLAASGPETRAAAANSRPVSGQNPQAGPEFKQASGIWSVTSPETVLRNTVSDADGDKSTETFEVWTTDANGKAKDKVKLVDDQYGVLVSPAVASGKTAEVTVPAGKLKPGVTYTFHTSAFDGHLYETEWSPWAKFRIAAYTTFPAPQASSSIDPVAESPQEIFRSDPGALAIRKSGGKNCSKPDDQGRQVCLKFHPASQKSQKSLFSAKASVPDLVSWCSAKPSGHDYITRNDACLNDVGSAELIFTSGGDKDKPPFGMATFNFQQRLKAYPNKTAGGSDFAEFDQQLFVTPTSIDPQLLGVRLTWNAGTVCDHCTSTQVAWKDYLTGASAGGYWLDSEVDKTQVASTTTKWTGTGKETIDLTWNMTAAVDVDLDLSAKANFGTSGNELKVRCDDLSTGSQTPGCVLPYYTPTYTVDTNLYPAAGAYYWFMQHRMTGAPGTGDAPLHYLGPDTTKTNSKGDKWTRADSRAVVCPKTWTRHPLDAALGEPTCDEFSMASTHESGGYPDAGNKYQVADGNECAQLYAAPSGSSFGIFADTRTDKSGPSTAEKCGRATIPGTQNEQAFTDLPAPSWRMLDGDAFYLSNPGFEHCTSTSSTCAWKKIS
ncbi:hypothetical protein ABII15_00050 [Streptomyces sp. HUAS MG91]|uniref:Uncharacterized protein n=1 Tax=Streptomyces tabacisoli TaxID=3156398 RepID=A0AAU8IJP2_9ACTN